MNNEVQVNRGQIIIAHDADSTAEQEILRIQNVVDVQEEERIKTQN